MNLKKNLATLMLISLLLLVTGCGKESDSVSLISSNDVEFGKEDYKNIASRNNELGFKLFAETSEGGNSNVFISPIGLYMVLSMLYNGAEGKTKQEIAKVLHVEGMNVNELNKSNAWLQSKLQKESTLIEFNITNSIWVHNHFHFKSEFVKSNRKYFNATLEEINMNDQNSLKRINDWGKKSTNGKMDQIVNEPLSDDVVTMLINAIYFKGDWTYPFDKEHTEKQSFYLKDGTTKDVPLMVLNRKLAYFEHEIFQAVSLPYGDETMSMKVLLPKENYSLEELEDLFTMESWKQWSSAFHKKSGTILLPTFQLEYEANVNDFLISLGMPSAFSSTANFSKMIKEENSLAISEVKQKTFLEVNEEGTEAAAITSVTIAETSAPVDSFFMKVNRPFIIVITDDETDTILFMGLIANPMERKQ